MSRIVVVSGSNVDPGVHLSEAARILSVDFVLHAAGGVHREPAYGPPGQPDFANQGFLLSTELGDVEVKAKLREIESAMGRVRTADKYAPRVIDLDLVWRDGVVLDPDVAERKYLQAILRELVG